MSEPVYMLLERDHAEDIDWQGRNEAEAERARRAGDMAVYLDLSLHLRLPDDCWALERYAEARRWYRHNARILTETLAWRGAHSGPDYPLEELFDLEAQTLARAGELRAAGPALERALTYWRDRAGGRLIVSALSLHAAQLGLPQLTQGATEAIAARAELPGAGSAAQQRLRAQLAYETAQVQLLLGNRDELAQALEPINAAIAKLGRRAVFDEPLQIALCAAGRGMRRLLVLWRGDIDPAKGRAAARADFEEAMAGFYLFQGAVDHNVYFMRLNTLLADDLAAGRQPNPNPFAGDDHGVEESSS